MTATAPGIDDALLQDFGGEAAEHHRMRRTDARAGLHGDHGLDRHRHVDDHAVAGLDASASARWRTGRRGGSSSLVGDRVTLPSSASKMMATLSGCVQVPIQQYEALSSPSWNHLKNGALLCRASW